MKGAGEAGDMQTHGDEGRERGMEDAAPHIADSRPVVVTLKLTGQILGDSAKLPL